MNETMRVFWEGRRNAAMARAVLYEGAIAALTTGGVQSYQLDTGQTRQLVTRADLAKLEAGLQSALNAVATIDARLGCGGATHVVPGF